MAHELDWAYLKRSAADTDRQMRPLVVLIVTYKSHALVEKCLAQVGEHLPELSVYVYENSGDQYPGREELAARHPEVHWVLGSANVGFAAAVNELVDHTPADADLLLLNPDAQLLGPLTRTRDLIRRPGVAAVSPLIRDNAGQQPWDVATRRRTLTRALVAAAGYSDDLRGSHFSHLYAHQPAESEDIDGYVSGVCLAISRDVWNTIGGFDEEFFLYGEETDWQARARAAGWRIVLADEFSVDHRGESDSLVDSHGPAVGLSERGRNYDLLRSNIALLLEHQRSVHHADVYLAGTTVLDRVQRSRRRARRHVAARRSDLPTIVITTNRLVYGGAERQKVLLATELVRRGYSVTLVCLQRFGPLIKDIPHSVRTVRQPWWAPVVDIPAGPAVLITGNTNTETGFGTLWRSGRAHRRWLLAGHNSNPLTTPMQWADGFVALSDVHWDALAADRPFRKPHFVAPNGVASVRMIDGSPRPVRPRRQPGEPLHLVMLSRIDEHKNPHWLIEALDDLSHLPWTLSIFGDGPDRAQLQARTPTRLHDRVRWHGWSAGPDPALADADLLCMPSRWEAFPMVILEAMVRGVPVAGSAVGSVPEMLDYGRAGYLVEPVSVEGWRRTLSAILTDPASLADVARRGFEHMRANYTVDAMTDAYVHAIGSVW